MRHSKSHPSIWLIIIASGFLFSPQPEIPATPVTASAARLPLFPYDYAAIPGHGPVAVAPDVPMAALVLTSQQAQIAVQQDSLVSASGWFSVIWEDTYHGSNITATRRYGLVTEQGQWIALQIADADVERFGGVLALNRRRVRVVGNRLVVPDQTAFNQSTPRQETIKIQSIELEANKETINDVKGTQKWVTILCRFADSTSITPKPVSHFQSLMGSAYPGMDHYWREVSYGNISIEGSTIVGWYNLPQPRSYYVYERNGTLEFDAERAIADCLIVADADVFFPNYDGINLMFNQELVPYSAGSTTRPIVRDGVSKLYGLNWIAPFAYGATNTHGSWVLAHEMGHTFGLPHSSGAYNETYDSNWDVMSGGGICSSRDVNYGCIPIHTISYHKNIVGWIPSARKYVATGGTTLAINIERIAQPMSDTNYLMAQIPIGGSTTKFYTVEARFFAGYDNQVPGQAIIIHSVDTKRGTDLNATYARVIDPDNNGNPNDAGAMWTVGETFTDVAYGIQVKVNSMNASSFNVTITNNCTYSASTPTNQLFTPSGGTGTVSVTANGNCSWEAGSDVGWISFPSGNVGNGSGTATYSVAPNIGGARAGNIAVAGQTYPISQAAPTYTISGQVASSGSGLSGVAMFLFLNGSQTATATTDANGNYSFANLTGGGNYFVSLSKPGYSFDPQNRQFNNLGNDQTANFIGTVLSYTIGGRVVNLDGAGIGGVLVTLSGAASAQTSTDDNGNFSFGSYPGGRSFTLVASKPGFFFRPSSWTNPNLGSNLVASFVGSPFYAVNVRVVDSSGNGLSGVTVTLSGDFGGSRTTDQNGSASFSLPGVINVTITPTKIGFSFNPTAVSLSNFNGDQTVNFTINAAPDLALTKSHSGNFIAGTNGLYTLMVRNVGATATTAGITVTDTLPAGLGFVSGSGTGWSCSASGQSVTCTNAGPLAPNVSSSISLTVSASGTAAPNVTNTASVATAGDANAANNTASDATTVSCSFAVSPASRSFESAGGSGSATVTAAGGCAWTASVNASGAGWITITAGASGSGNGSVAYSVTANPNPSPRTGTLTITGQTVTVLQAAVMASVSAASFSGAELASESIVAAFGAGLATTTQTGNTLPLPTELAGTSVKVRDSAGTERLASLFFVAPGQINYLIPADTASGTATIIVTSNGNVVATGAVKIAAVAPGLFAANANGQGVAAGVALRVKANGAQSFETIARFDTATQRFVSTPIDLGPTGEQVFLLLFGTGIRGRSALAAVTCTIGGVTVPVSFAGAQGDLVGLDQVNIGALPRALAGRGEVDLVLTVDGKTANTVRVNIK